MAWDWLQMLAAGMAQQSAPAKQNPELDYLRPLGPLVGALQRPLRPMERHEQRAAVDRARSRLTHGRSADTRDVAADLDWHADSYGYEGLDPQRRDALAAQVVGNYEQQQAMQALASPQQRGRRR